MAHTRIELGNMQLAGQPASIHELPSNTTKYRTGDTLEVRYFPMRTDTVSVHVRTFLNRYLAELPPRLGGASATFRCRITDDGLMEWDLVSTSPGAVAITGSGNGVSLVEVST